VLRIVCECPVPEQVEGVVRAQPLFRVPGRNSNAAARSAATISRGASNASRTHRAAQTVLSKRRSPVAAIRQSNVA